MRDITLTISTDAQGFSKNATLIASIVRRTSRRVRVRCYTRGFSQVAFAVGNLSVEFIRCEQEVSGTFPGHVPIAVFDRLRVMHDDNDWERCLVLDHDMVCLSDLGEYFDEEFEGNLLMGRLFGPGNTLGLQMKRRGGLPPELAHAEEAPYFYMGPLMNLSLMRQENTWATLLECHRLLGQEEQLALTAATAGRTKGVDPKWNQVPQWDNKNGNVLSPTGIIHWTGGGKPWHRNTKVWRPEIWEAERCNWESLRAGEWDKPVAEDYGGTGARAAQGLLRRGWRVISHGNEAVWDKPWQDLVRGAADQSVLMRRFGPTMPSEEIIKILAESSDSVPVILEGYHSEEEIRRISGSRYNASIRWLTKDWPAGGPAPEILDKQAGIAAQSLHPGEEICLFVASAKELRQVPVAMPLARKEDDSWRLHQAACDWLRTSLAELLPASSGKKRRILELGTGRSTEVLAEQFSDAGIVTLEHDATWYHRHQEALAPFPHVACLLAPLDAGLRWYDLSQVPAGPYDFLLVDGPPRTCGGKNRDAAKCLLPWLAEDAIILLDDTDAAMVSSWTQLGYAILHQDESFAVLKRTRACESLPTERHESLAALAAKTYVISLPDREDRREALKVNWGRTEPYGLVEKQAGSPFAETGETRCPPVQWIDGIRCAAEDISWSEMKGMEAYGDAAKLRGDYVLGAVGCKRAGIAALRAFLASGATTALICQDDCHWVEQANEQIARALQEVPADWDLLYFSATQRSPYIPVSPFWMKLTGGRLCSAIVWKRETAMRLLPALEVCDCEWDVFMEREHPNLNAYAMRPMPAYQAASFSDIVRRQTQVANR